MSKSFDEGKEQVGKLCQYFATNRPASLAPGVKEAHVRQPLIDPFFEAVGWHVRNTALLAPHYREVTQRQIDATDGEVDRLVYDLYGLTAEEIAILEAERQ